MCPPFNPRRIPMELLTSDRPLCYIEGHSHLSPDMEVLHEFCDINRMRYEWDVLKEIWYPKDVEDYSKELHRLYRRLSWYFKGEKIEADLVNDTIDDSHLTVIKPIAGFNLSVPFLNDEQQTIYFRTEVELKFCLSIAAARYGQAKLMGTPQLECLVLNEILNPRCQWKWMELVANHKSSLSSIINFYFDTPYLTALTYEEFVEAGAKQSELISSEQFDNHTIISQYGLTNSMIYLLERVLRNTRLSNDPAAHIQSVVLGTHWTLTHPEYTKSREIFQRIESQYIDENNVLDPATLAEEDRRCAVCHGEYMSYDKAASDALSIKLTPKKIETQAKERTALASYIRILCIRERQIERSYAVNGNVIDIPPIPGPLLLEMYPRPWANNILQNPPKEKYKLDAECNSDDRVMPVRMACPSGHHICYDCTLSSWKMRTNPDLRCMYCRFELNATEHARTAHVKEEDRKKGKNDRGEEEKQTTMPIGTQVYGFCIRADQGIPDAWDEEAWPILPAPKKPEAPEKPKVKKGKKKSAPIPQAEPPTEPLAEPLTKSEQRQPHSVEHPENPDHPAYLDYLDYLDYLIEPQPLTQSKAQQQKQSPTTESETKTFTQRIRAWFW